MLPYMLPYLVMEKFTIMIKIMVTTNKYQLLRTDTNGKARI